MLRITSTLRSSGSKTAKWNQGFLGKLGSISGKGAESKTAVKDATDFLGQALADSGYINETPVAGKKEPLKVKEQADPTQELIDEINKIKERLSILPIKSSGALFGPGEGVMQIYKQMQEAEVEKENSEKLKRIEKRRVQVLEGGFSMH
eukprot:TRINITY_DN2949_c5_g1_i1.p1 TRINITY_DN2949_c5_g1~~TRINITY_DN2949_c5_g1_i1.p1  ORF type:complete len:149 (+),score=37.35 TRINITY_DN2949_c5_g1_i1:130-576(+)